MVVMLLYVGLGEDDGLGIGAAWCGGDDMTLL